MPRPRSKPKEKPIDAIDQLVSQLKSWGVGVQAFRFTQGPPLVLIKSPKTGYLVWIVLHVKASDNWSPELVEQMINTNYGAIIATDLVDIKKKLREKHYLEAWHRERLAVMMQAGREKESFTQQEVLQALSAL